MSFFTYFFKHLQKCKVCLFNCIWNIHPWKPKVLCVFLSGFTMWANIFCIFYVFHVLFFSTYTTPGWSPSRSFLHLNQSCVRLMPSSLSPFSCLTRLELAPSLMVRAGFQICCCVLNENEQHISRWVNTQCFRIQACRICCFVPLRFYFFNCKICPQMEKLWESTFFFVRKSIFCVT